MGGGATTPIHVAAIPFPGRGHVNPLLELCKTMALKKPNNFHISFIVTQEWLDLLNSSDQPLPPTISIRFTPIPDVLPSEVGRGADLEGFMKAVLEKMIGPVQDLVDRFDPPVQLIIADTFLPWAVEIGNRRNVPVASFWPASASMFSMFLYYDLILDNLAQLPPGKDSDHRLDNIPGISSISLGDLPDGFSPEYRSKMRNLLHMITVLNNCKCLVFRTLKELEEAALSSIKCKLPVPMYMVGPCIPFLTNGDNINNHSSVPTYIAWLNSQPKKSVLYVSLGSVISISSHQVAELAAGLRDSGVRFLWVSRGDTLTFEGGPGEKGKVVPWCDQWRVLCHGSIGGFLTHCGWNSVLECIFTGMPIITFPFFMDQKLNSKLVVEDWRIGRHGRSTTATNQSGVGGSVVPRDTIAEVIKMFMDLESSHRKEMEERCSQLRETLQAALANGGSAQLGIDAFLANI